MAVTLAKTTDSYTPPQTRTVALTREVTLGVSLVGAIVTYNAQQYRVYDVEGDTWYASGTIGQVDITTGLPHAWWYKTPTATLLPMDAQIGEGRSFPVEINRLTRGVCLAK